MDAIDIKTRINRRWRACQIYDVSYPTFSDEASIPDVIVGSVLPSGPGFPYRLERPLVSFKVFRSFVDAGQECLVRRVISTKCRSTLTPNNIWCSVLKFAQPTAKKPKILLEEYRECLSWVREQFTVPEKLRPLPIAVAMRKVPQSTSPGLPYIRTHPGWKKGEVYDRYQQVFDTYWDRVGLGKPVGPLPDCAAFSRSHIGSYGTNKVRPVWAVPCTVIAQEARTAHPFTQALKEQVIGLRTAYGAEMMKGGMHWLNSELLRYKRKEPGCKFVMTDFSGFDSSVPAWLIRDCFGIIADQFDFSQDTEGNKLNPAAEFRKFQACVRYFINTPIQNMDGKRFNKVHGVPSGSMWTNIVDTMCNLIISRMTCNVCTGSFPLFINCFGDDSILVLKDRSIVDLKAFATFQRDYFGVELSLKKSYWTNLVKNVHYLGYYNNNGQPIKTPEDLAASMLYPQYFKDDWTYCIARSLGCLLAAGGSSSDITLVCRMIYFKASREAPDNISKGLELISSNPRMLRRLESLGCSGLDLTTNYFLSNRLCIPYPSCSKITMNIKT